MSLPPSLSMKAINGSRGNTTTPLNSIEEHMLMSDKNGNVRSNSRDGLIKKFIDYKYQPAFMPSASPTNQSPSRVAAALLETTKVVLENLSSVRKKK